MSNPSTTRRLIPVTQWNEFHPWPPIGGLRHLIFHAQTNGFRDAFKRVGTGRRCRVLVDEPVFFECVDRQQKHGRAA